MASSARRRRLAQPIAAGGHRRRVERRACGCSMGAGREPEIDRAAAFLLLQMIEGPAQDRGQLVDEGGLEHGEAGLAEADQRGDDRLMRAAFRRQRNARGRRHQQEARILIAGVVQRIEAARDEGIIDRPDGQQPRAEQRLGQAERRQQQEQIVLGDAELDMPALRRADPVLGRGQLAVAEDVGMRRAGEEADLIDPAAEIGRDRDVGRGGDDALARAPLPDFASSSMSRPKPSCVDMRLAGRQRQPRHRQHRRRLARLGEAAELHGQRARRSRAAAGAGGIQAGEMRPTPRPARCPASLEGRHLRLVHQPGVIVLVAGEGQAEALDRVGDEAGRPIVSPPRRTPRRSPPCHGRRDWSSGDAAPHRHGSRARAGCRCPSPRLASSSRRNPAPPSKVSAE